MTTRRDYDYDYYDRDRNDRDRRRSDWGDLNKEKRSERGLRNERTSRDSRSHDDDDMYGSSSYGSRYSRDYDERGSGEHDGYRNENRGFASMDPEDRREIARMGGRASHGNSGNYPNRNSFRYEDDRGRQDYAYSDYDDRYEMSGRGYDEGSGQDDDNDERYDSRYQNDNRSYNGRESYSSRNNSSRYENEYDRRDGNSRNRRGFAGMDPEERREISGRGGRAAHRAGTAHEFTSQEARRAAQSRRY